MVFILLYTYYVTPFVDPLNDFMDECGRITSVIATIGALVNIWAPPYADSATGEIIPSKVGNAVGVVVMAAGFINVVIMCGIMFSGLESVRNKYKNWFGVFTFYDSCKNMADLSAANAISTWQLEREVKHRVWQTFWDSMLVHQCGEQTAGRLLHLKNDAITYGIEYIDNHWSGMAKKEVRELREELRQKWEGVDLYWDDATGARDGKLDSVTCFGKMYATPYPFHVVIVYDDAIDETFIKEDKMLLKFKEMQERADIRQKVHNRRCIRGLASQPALVRHPFQRMESRRVADGTDHYTDSKGKSHSKTHYSTINILISYTMGKVNLAVENEYSHSAGFTATMFYCDGHGSAIKPRTGATYSETNAQATMELAHMGLNAATFDPSKDASGGDLWQKFLSDVAASAIDMEAQLARIAKFSADYRLGLANKFDGNNQVLADSFWYYCYNDANVERERLETYFHTLETNPFLKRFPEDNAEGLDYLFTRMKFIGQMGEKSRLWFVFWEDFYMQNKDMTAVATYAAVFNPTRAGALCYNYKTRPELEQYLRNMSLLSTCCKKYIDKLTLDTLYDRLEKPEAYPLLEYRTEKQKRMDQLMRKDVVREQLNRFSILAPGETSYQSAKVTAASLQNSVEPSRLSTKAGYVTADAASSPMAIEPN